MSPMKIYISRKTRQALLDAGFPRQTINNWISGRYKPSRISKTILLRIIAQGARKNHNK